MDSYGYDAIELEHLDGIRGKFIGALKMLFA